MSRFIDRQFLRHLAGTYVVTGLGYVAPLLVVPVLAHRLAPEVLAAYFYAQAIGATGAVVIDYGLSVGAARRAAQAGAHRANAIEALAAQVVSARLMLAAAIAAVILMARPVIPYLRDDLAITVLCVMLSVGAGLFPAWYFQAEERNLAVARCEIAVKALAVIAVLSLVPSGAPAWVPLAIAAMMQWLSTGFAMSVMHRRVRFAVAPAAAAVALLRSERRLAVYRLVTTLYNSINTVLLGFVAPAAQVAAYAVAEKIVKAALSALLPMQQASLARATHWLDVRRAAYRGVLVRTLVWYAAIGIVAAAALALVAPVLVHLLFGSAHRDATLALRILALILPLVCISGALCNNYLLPAKREGAIMVAVVLAAAANCASLWMVFGAHGAAGGALSWLAAEGCALVVLLWAVRREVARMVGTVAGVRARMIWR